MSAKRFYLHTDPPNPPGNGYFLGTTFPSGSLASEAGPVSDGNVAVGIMSLASSPSGVAQVGLAGRSATAWCNTFCSPRLARQTLPTSLTVRSGVLSSVSLHFNRYFYGFIWRPSTGTKIIDVISNGSGGYAPGGTSLGDGVANVRADTYVLSVVPALVQQDDIFCLEWWIGGGSGGGGTVAMLFDGAIPIGNDGTINSQPASYAEFSSLVYFTGDADAPPPPYTGPGLPPRFYLALDKPLVSFRRWIEVAGMPYGYGNLTEDATFFARRAVTDQLLGIRPWMADVPTGLESDLDPLADAVPSNIGQLQFDIVDPTDELTAWTGVGRSTDWVRLNGGIAATDTTISFTGDSSGFPSSGVLYIGAETVQYTGITLGLLDSFTGCTRGVYRSTPQAWGDGTPVGPRPYTLKGREVWYYNIAGDKEATLWDEDKALRLHGTFEGFQYNVGGEYSIIVQSLEKSLNRSIFTNLITYTDSQQLGISAIPFGSDQPGIRFTTDPGGAFGSNILSGPDAQGLPDGYGFVARVDDELFYFIAYIEPSILLMDQRGLFGTQVAAHRPGFNLKEVAWVAEPVTTSADIIVRENHDTKFNSTRTDASPLPANHPLMVLLQVLLSTGLGTNAVGGRRNYDVLPVNWSLGIPVSRVDVDGIEAAALESPDLRVNGVWLDAVTFLDFAQQLLKPFGYYAFTLLGDRWTIRRFRPPLPDVTPTAIGNSNRISAQISTWDANLDGVVQEVVFQYDYDIVEDEYRSISVNELNETQLFSEGQGQRLEVDCPFLYSPNSSQVGKPRLSGQPSLEGILRERIEFYKRFTRPPAQIVVRTALSTIGIEPGDVVALSHSSLPNLRTAALGLSSSNCQVLKRAVDDQAKVIDFTLLNLDYQLGQYRYIAPSLRIDSTATTTTFVYAANAFSLSLSMGLAQDDNQLIDGNGAVSTPFRVGEPILIWASDFSARVAATITAVNLTTRTVTVGSAPSTALAAGQIVTLAGYDTASSADQGLYVFLADSSGTLGTANDAADTYFP